MFKYFIAILISITLASCMDQNCIEADDFGFPSVTIPVYSNYGSVQGQGSAQYVPWIDSGYVLNGYPLVIVVHNWSKGSKNTSDALSAWCPWYGSSSYGSTLAPICEQFSPCAFAAKGEVPNYSVQNPPCVMNKGKGLYAALVNPGYNINGTSSTIQAPDPNQVFAVHLGEDLHTPLTEIDDNGNMQQAGGIWLNGTSKFIPTQAPNVNAALINSSFINYQSINNTATIQSIVGTKLYFKILDTYYGDNSGQYQVTIKSGVALPSTDVFSTVVSLVKSILFGSVSTNNGEGGASILASNNNLDVSSNGIIFGIFNNITNNSSFKNAVTRILTIYVIFTAIFYLLGFINLSIKELLTILIKIGVMAALLSPNSWAFFYNNLFILFISGSDEIINLIKTAGATGPGSDSIVALMVAPQTLIKLASLLAIDGKAWLYMFLYFLLLLYLLFVLASATLLFLNALIIVGIIISIGPIFFCFMLFSKTSSLYKNWLSQLFAYSMQPVILFTGITFMSVLIRHQIYTTLGFKVCKNYFWQIGGQNTPWYWWLPSPYTAGKFTTTPISLYVPEDHWQTTPAATQTTNLCTPNPDYISYGILPPAVNNAKYCKAYECVEPRLVDLPFLDLNVTSDCQKAQDFVSGNFIQLSPLMLLVILIFLLDKFNAMAVEIAQFLTKGFAGGGGAMNLRSAGGWFNQFANSVINVIAEKTYLNKVMKVINDKVGGIIRKPLALVLSADTYKSGAKFVVQKSLSIPLQVYKLRKLWVKKVDSANKLPQLIKLQKDYNVLLKQQEALKGMQISDVRRQRMQNNINFLDVKLQPYKAMLEKLKSKNIKLEDVNLNAKQQLQNALTASLNRLNSNPFTAKLDRNQIKSATRDLMRVNKLSTEQLKQNLILEVYGPSSTFRIATFRQREYANLSVEQKNKIDQLYKQRYGEKIEDRTKYQLAQILYKQSFDDLSDKRKEKINQATSQTGSLSIVKLSEDYRNLRTYQDFYVKDSLAKKDPLDATVKISDGEKNALTASLNIVNSNRNFLVKLKQKDIESAARKLLIDSNLSEGQLKQELVEKDRILRLARLLGSKDAAEYSTLSKGLQKEIDNQYKQRYGGTPEDRIKYQLAQTLYKKSFDDLSESRQNKINQALNQTGALSIAKISDDVKVRNEAIELRKTIGSEDKLPEADVPQAQTSLSSEKAVGALEGDAKGALDFKVKGALDGDAKGILGESETKEQITKPSYSEKELTVKPTTSPETKLPDPQGRKVIVNPIIESEKPETVSSDVRGAVIEVDKSELGQSSFDNEPLRVVDQFGKDPEMRRKELIQKAKEKEVGGLAGDFAGGMATYPEGAMGQEIKGGLGEMDFYEPTEKEGGNSKAQFEEDIKKREFLAAEIAKADKKAEAIAKAKEAIAGEYGDISSDSAEDHRPSRPINTNKKPPK